MKIRTDFVTNSSSSSFVVYGLGINDGLKLTDEYCLKFFNDKLEKSWCSKDLKIKAPTMSDQEKIDYIRKYINIEGLSEIFYGKKSTPLEIGGYDNNIVGIHPSKMLKLYPEAQMKDAMKLVAAEINKVFGTNFTESDIKFFEESWYDG